MNSQVVLAMQYWTVDACVFLLPDQPEEQSLQRPVYGPRVEATDTANSLNARLVSKITVHPQLSLFTVSRLSM